MSVHLIGGGRDDARCAALAAPFVTEATAAAGTDEPVIAVLLVLEPDDDTSEERFRSVLIAGGASFTGIRVDAILEGERFAAAAVDGAHGIFIGGGLTPAYHDAVMEIADAIRARVAAGAAYAGFSAGAVIAASRAIVGGYRLHGAEVSPEDAGEELDELEVRDGLGLVPMSIDVHAAQWGTLGRLVAAVAADLTPAGAAIDEHTALVVGVGGAAEAAVHGDGHVWHVERLRAGVQVSMRGALRG
jgi:cyanophycinase